MCLPRTFRPHKLRFTTTFAGNRFVRVQGPGIGRRSYLAVVSDRECWTNFHRTLGGCGLSIAVGLSEKIDGCFVAVRFQKHRRFFKTSPTHGAGSVDEPGSGNVQRLLAVFVRHVAVFY